MLNKMWKILNPKHQILNKSKYLSSNFKTNHSLTEKQKSLFLSFGFWYLILFSISSLVLRIYKSMDIGQLISREKE